MSAEKNRDNSTEPQVGPDQTPGFQDVAAFVLAAFLNILPLILILIGVFALVLVIVEIVL